MGMNSFAPGKPPINGCFIVQNTSPQIKTISIFTYPINYLSLRNLLYIPGVSESDIRASLLKGELKHKIKCKDIVVVCSDIDLLQFNDAQKSFLEAAGITDGLAVSGGGGSFPYLFKENQPLTGSQNSSNRVFTTPDFFLNGLQSDNNNFRIFVTYNGLKQKEGIDYNVSSSIISSIFFDTITFINKSPKSSTILQTSYIINNGDF